MHNSEAKEYKYISESVKIGLAFPCLLSNWLTLQTLSDNLNMIDSSCSSCILKEVINVNF